MKNLHIKPFNSLVLVLLVGTALLIVSCKKFVDIGAPVTSINEKNVYAQDNTAIAVLTGVYANLTNSFTGSGGSNISLQSGLSADEFTLYSEVTNEVLKAHYKNTLVSNSAASYGGNIWQALYSTIFTCNSAIKGLEEASTLTPSVKQQLLGEAKFIRSFCYFYIANLYGGGPLVLGTDPDVNTLTTRSSAKLLYDQLIADLVSAQQLLNAKYVNISLAPYASNAERLRPTSWAATALLARAYLYNKNYAEAEIEASKVIAQKDLFDTVAVNTVFLKNSKEAIWQLQPIRTNRNTEDALVFIIPSAGPSNMNFSSLSGNPVYLSSSLLAAFETGDKRRSVGNWVNSITVGGVPYNYPYKYKLTTGTVNEYNMVLRLTEQYLIRAEARAQQGKMNGLEDLNVVRKHAGLPNATAATPEILFEAVIKERRVELFSEWGHRWMDLKRTGKTDQVMAAAAAAKGTVWNTYQQLYPIPFDDISRSPVLVQNNGY